MEKKKTVIHFVRHGKVDNPGNVRYGRLPGYHLDEEGRRMVEETSLFFVGKPITHIYASPMERAQQTATLVGLALPHVPITLDDRIMEVKTAAEFEGLPRTSDFYYPNQATAEAETQGQIIARLHAFVEEKVIRHNGQEIIAVCHGDPMMLLKNWLTLHEESVEAGTYPNFASVFSYVFEGLSLRALWYRGNAGKRG